MHNIIKLFFLMKGRWKMGKSAGNQKEDEKEDVEKAFITTLPGILTAVATLITAAAGCIAIILSPGVWDRFFPRTPTPVVMTEAPATATFQIPTMTYAATTTTVPPTMTASVTPPVIVLMATPTPVTIPHTSNFQACSSPCNGKNSTSNFSPGITKIFIQFNYQDFTSGMPYVRTWSLNGAEWIRYTCAWDGPDSGVESIKLTEPGGLKSGVWEMKITGNNTVLLDKQITVVGNWNFWEPAGTINACRGAN